MTALRLRKLAELPPTRLDATPWSAQTVLWETWRRERKRPAQVRRQLQRERESYAELRQHIKVNNNSGEHE